MLQTEEIILTNRLKTAVNAVLNAAAATGAGSRGTRGDEEARDAAELEDAQNAALEKLILFRKRYHQIDTDFKDEIRGQGRREFTDTSSGAIDDRTMEI
jgi:hypothetical protein